MTIADKLTQIAASKSAIRAAIEAKGVPVPPSTPLADYADLIAAIQAATPDPPPGPDAYTYLRGVNLAGGEFAHNAPTLPGTSGIDYVYPTAATCQFIYDRGHRLVRLPFRWERVQQTLGGALDATGIAELQAAVQRCVDAGLFVLLDLHNYGRYVRLDDVEVMFEAGVTQAHFADIWTKLVGAFADQPAVIGWGLLNEPYDLPVIPAVPGTFTGTTLATFDATVEGWGFSTGSGSMTVGSFPGMTGAGALTVSTVLPANSGNYNSAVIIQSQPGAAKPSFPAGSMLRYQFYVPTSTPGTVRVRPGIVSSSYQIVQGSYTNLPKGQIVHVDMTVPAAQQGTAHEHVTLQIEVDGSDGTTPTVVQIGNYAVGSVSGGTPEQKVWPLYGQAAVTAIRDTGDTRDVYIAGDNFSGAAAWTTHNPATPWITDPAGAVVYEAHYYFNESNSGAYGTYAAANTDAVSRGYADLAAKITAEVGVFTSWLSTHGQRGFIGELGWPKNADSAQWNAAGEHLYDLLDAAGVSATYWATGDHWGDAYDLEPYDTSEQTLHAQAAILEAHPSQVTA